MTIFVKRLNGRVVQIEVGHDTLVVESLQEIADFIGLPPGQLRLVWAGKLLDYSKTWRENGYCLRSDHSSVIIHVENRPLLWFSIMNHEGTLPVQRAELDRVRQQNLQEERDLSSHLTQQQLYALRFRHRQEEEAQRGNIAEEEVTVQRWKSALYASGPFAAWKLAVKQAADTRQVLEQLREEDALARQRLGRV